jgi:protein TonB
MLLAIQRPEESEARSLLGWIVPASVALHVLVVIVLPSSTSQRAFVPPPVVIEVAEPPPVPPPPPVESEAPKATAESAPPVSHAPRAGTPRQPSRTTTDTPSQPTPAEAPVDFTGTSFSNDGPGVAISSSAEPGGAAIRPAISGAPSAPRAPVPSVPTFVPAAALGRPPRAPGLDAELERNYPPDARRSGISGNAVLRVQLLADGRVGKVELVSETFSGFGAACERTVRGGHWEPPLDREGRPVGTEIKYVCKFEVRS